MKICILASSFILSDGISRVVQLQAKKYAKEGNEVKIITFKTEKKMESEHYKIKKIGSFPKKILFKKIHTLLFCFGIIRRDSYKELKDADLVISHFFDMNILASKAKKKYKIKYRYHHHGLIEALEFHSFMDRIMIKTIWFLIRRTLKNVDEVSSISKAAQKELLNKTGLKSKLEYNYIDEERFNKKINAKKIIEKYKLKNKKMFFFVGAITPIKGINYLIESFKKADIKNSLLLIAGRTHETGYMISLKKLAEPSENIKFIGTVSDKDLPKFYKAATAYVSCAQGEGFGMPVAEAQACGTYSIVFDAGAHKEILNNGILIKKNDTDAFAKAMRKKAGMK